MSTDNAQPSTQQNLYVSHDLADLIETIANASPEELELLLESAPATVMFHPAQHGEAN